MRLSFVLYFFLFSITSVYCQSEFKINSPKKKVVIPFKLINNLIFIPIKVNGEELTFLLDTGVEETILFSLDDKEQIQFFHIEQLKLKGLGSNDAVDAYKSSKNKLDANGFVDLEHEIYIVLDQEFNFSSQVGIPVNGIIGYHFFKNHKVEINYETKKVIVYADENQKIAKQLKRSYKKASIAVEESKPYFISNIQQDDKTIPSKLLLDTGNSDALWIFLNKAQNFTKPEKTIHDFLGRGFSGDIFGLRGRISGFDFGTKQFKNPIVTFPDSTSIKSVNFVPNRIGSIGGEVLSRFTIVFDYKNNAVYSSPNGKINDPFNFNMSGIEVEHAGLEWTKQTFGSTDGIKVYTSASDERVQDKLQIRFELKPVFKIASVRVNSNAEKSGLKKGDRIMKINGRNSQDLTIEKINELLKSEEGKTIKIEIERNNITLTYQFQLKSIL
ncbi:PDZ domain-containing protein [Flavobacterium phycosphaerae]|uniref:PDZ domain-containing protein n=1 Tax=Flavobacterium phycosphaerae TaxID=2697515 RepID=UPI00138ABB3C|nr:PDZ domain-containing protein [Flavobacterium phycosphaerae]